SSTASAFASMVNKPSTPRAASGGDAARRAPRSANGSTLAAVRFHTVTSWPASTRRVAMGAPIEPRPRNASFAIPAASFGVRGYPARASVEVDAARAVQADEGRDDVRVELRPRRELQTA